MVQAGSVIVIVYAVLLLFFPAFCRISIDHLLKWSQVAMVAIENIAILH
jgi:hypothetical protein